MSDPNTNALRWAAVYGAVVAVEVIRWQDSEGTMDSPPPGEMAEIVNRAWAVAQDAELAFPKT